MEFFNDLYSANQVNIVRISDLLDLVRADPDPELRREYVDKLNLELVSAQQFAEWLISNRSEEERPNIARRRKPHRQQLVVDRIEAGYMAERRRREDAARRRLTRYPIPDYVQDNRNRNSITPSTMPAPAEGSRALTHRSDASQEARIPSFRPSGDGPGGRFFVLEEDKPRRRNRK